MYYIFVFAQSSFLSCSSFSWLFSVFSGIEKCLKIQPSGAGCSFLYLSLSLLLLSVSSSLPLCLSLPLLHTPTLLHVLDITTLSCTNTVEGREEGGMVMTSDGNVLWLESHLKLPQLPQTVADRPSCYRGPRMHGSVNRSGCFAACTLFFLTDCSSLLCFKTKLNLISFPVLCSVLIYSAWNQKSTKFSCIFALESRR